MFANGPYRSQPDVVGKFGVPVQRQDVQDVFATVGAGVVGVGEGAGVGAAVGAGDGLEDGLGEGIGVGAGVGLGVGADVGDGVGGSVGHVLPQKSQAFSPGS